MGFGKGRNGSWEACGGRGRDVSVLDMSSGSGCKEQQLAEEISEAIGAGVAEGLGAGVREGRSVGSHSRGQKCHFPAGDAGQAVGRMRSELRGLAALEISAQWLSAHG